MSSRFTISCTSSPKLKSPILIIDLHIEILIFTQYNYEMPNKSLRGLVPTEDNRLIIKREKNFVFSSITIVY